MAFAVVPCGVFGFGVIFSLAVCVNINIAIADTWTLRCQPPCIKSRCLIGCSKKMCSGTQGLKVEYIKVVQSVSLASIWLALTLLHASKTLVECTEKCW